jgi:hypothetical protein
MSDVSEGLSSATEVDKVMEHAMVDPVVLEGPRKAQEQSVRPEDEYRRWEQFLGPDR